MPLYNESTTIVETLTSLRQALHAVGLTIEDFIVVDDCSTDLSVQKIQDLQSNEFPVRLYENLVNLGHGPTLVKALEIGLRSDAQFLIAIDSDGQFDPLQVAAASNWFLTNNYDLVECSRIKREDPLYRKFVTFLTKLLLWTRTHRLVPDANTPLRIYNMSKLSQLLCAVDHSSLIPNLHMSSISRKLGLNVGVFKVEFFAKAHGEAGTMFGAGTKNYLPTKRFVKFCFQSMKEWIATSFNTTR